MKWAYLVLATTISIAPIQQSHAESPIGKLKDTATSEGTGEITNLGGGKFDIAVSGGFSGNRADTYKKWDRTVEKACKGGSHHVVKQDYAPKYPGFLSGIIQCTGTSQSPARSEKTTGGAGTVDKGQNKIKEAVPAASSSAGNSGQSKAMGILQSASVYFWLLLLVVGFMVYRRSMAGSGLGPTLVLRRFEMTEPGQDGVFLRVVGRPSGLISWLMTTLRIEDETHLEVSCDGFNVRSSGLHGQLHRYTPLRSIATTHCGYMRPIIWLFIGGAILIGGLFQAIGERTLGAILGIVGGAIVISAIFFLIYWFSRKLQMWVVTHGSETLGITFKPSAIEFVSVNLDQALHAIAVINQRMIEAKAKFAPAQATPTPNIIPTPVAATRAKNQCRNCGVSLTQGAGFCAKCGTPCA